MRDSLHMPMRAVNISMFYVIRLCILHYALPECVLYWKVCHIYYLFRGNSSTAPESHLCLYWYVCASYTGVYIDVFLYVIQYNSWLYFILGIFYYISTMYGLFCHCVIVTYAFVLICLWMLYLCSLQYVCVLHNI